jgi:hypothetical protein
MRQGMGRIDQIGALCNGVRRGQATTDHEHHIRLAHDFIRHRGTKRAHRADSQGVDFRECALAQCAGRHRRSKTLCQGLDLGIGFEQHLENLRRKDMLPRLRNDRATCVLRRLFRLGLRRFC